MAVNDIFMLPERKRTMKEMADLLGAEQQELDRLYQLISDTENQLRINTSTSALGRYEAIFAVPAAGELSIEERRAKVIAKLNTRGSTTVQAIVELVRIVTGCSAEIVEHYGEYTFSVVVHLLYPDKTKDLQELIKQIEEIKPAHLVFDTIGAVEPFPFTCYNDILLKSLRMSGRVNNFGVESIYLDGRRNLDGTWILTQLFTKGISFHSFKVPLNGHNMQSVKTAITARFFELNIYRTLHRSTGINVKATEAETILQNNLKTEMSQKNNQRVVWVLIADTLYHLDGSSSLNGTKKLNAEIKRSEL